MYALTSPILVVCRCAVARGLPAEAVAAAGALREGAAARAEAEDGFSFSTGAASLASAASSVSAGAVSGSSAAGSETVSSSPAASGASALSSAGWSAAEDGSCGGCSSAAAVSCSKGSAISGSRLCVLVPGFRLGDLPLFLRLGRFLGQSGFLTAAVGRIMIRSVPSPQQNQKQNPYSQGTLLPARLGHGDRGNGGSRARRGQGPLVALEGNGWAWGSSVPAAGWAPGMA